MNQYIEFASNHWILVGLFFILLLVFIGVEVAERIVGVPRIRSKQLTDMVNHNDAVVVDLRTVDEYKRGHIANALNIPKSELPQRLEKLSDYKEKSVILICGTGQHASLAGSLLRKQGFSNIYLLAGGIATWQADNLPLVK